MNNMDEAVSFLKKCLDEDEAVIKTAASHGEKWRVKRDYGNDPQDIVVDDDKDEFRLSYITMDREGINPSVAERAADHIARFDPARMQAEVDVKRQVLSMYEYYESTDFWIAVKGMTVAYKHHPDYKIEYSQW